MASMQISGPHLQHYPGILAELERLNITLETLRYVDVAMKERIPRAPLGEIVTATKEVEAIATLHSGERIPLELSSLIYDAHPVRGQDGRNDEQGRIS